MERTPQGVRSFFQLSFIRPENAGALFRLHREDLDIALTGIDREQMQAAGFRDEREILLAVAGAGDRVTFYKNEV